MLHKLRVRGFKSLRSLWEEEKAVSFPRFTVLFGPNAAGKSNLIEAVEALSWIGTARTLSDVFQEPSPFGPVRGLPAEVLSFPSGGLAELLGKDSASFGLDAELSVERDLFRYRVEVEMQPRSGALGVSDEYLAQLKADGQAKGTPIIGEVEGQLRIRRRGKAAAPRHEPLHQNHSQLSDPALTGQYYRAIERVRRELLGWQVYYLDPRVYMRLAQPPSQVSDIGALGQFIAPFLFRLLNEQPKCFEGARNALRSIIPSIEGLSVELDKKRGTLDIQVRQSGIDFSSRVISEGTLRVLALCAIAVNPWGGSLVAFEEPENGVHPKRLELIAKLLASLALEQGKQVIVSTHSPLFCDAVLRLKEEAGEAEGESIELMVVKQGAGGTEVQTFRKDQYLPLLKERELRGALSSAGEDGFFEGVMLRGLTDE